MPQPVHSPSSQAGDVPEGGFTVAEGEGTGGSKPDFLGFRPPDADWISRRVKRHGKYSSAREALGILTAILKWSFVAGFGVIAFCPERCGT